MISLYPSPAAIRDTMARLRGAHVAVFGDFCVDGYWWIDSQQGETSLETGKAVRRVRRQRYTPGGAGNVVVNLRALGVGRVSALGVVGSDPFGHELVQMLGRLEVDTSGMLVQEEGWDTPVYNKPILQDEELERHDFGAFNELATETWERLLAALREARKGADFLVVNQQLPSGWCAKGRATALAAELHQAWPRKHLVDSRHFTRHFEGTCRKLNAHEAAQLVGADADVDNGFGDAEARDLGNRLSTSADEVQFVTRGARGIMVCRRGATEVIPGILVLGPTDPVGAGDAATATLAACLSAGIEPPAAACLANLAASVTVQKLKQTGTAAEEEIVEAAHHVAYVYHPSLADDALLAHRLNGTDIEVVEDPPRGAVRCAVFDHDGTISTLRQGWEAIMEPVMVRAIAGDTEVPPDSALHRRIRARVRDYIEQSTGIQTLVQMDDLVKMVGEFGLIPNEKILDAPGYKELYNRALMEMVDDRIRRLQRGELNVADFVIKGAVEFLSALATRGVALYLASGTDEEDVRREAEALGYAHLFGKNIRGAHRGSRACSKEEVIEDILSKGIAGDGIFLVAGDGPVEIRQARRHSGWALGVASHEERRFGLNPAKRRRLIRAGAHTVIPDFSQWERLVELISSSKVSVAA